MNFFLSFLLIFSLIFLFSSHPISFLIIILAQTMMICISMYITLKTSWYSYILFLIFLGGLMVLFVYVVSLASNEKFDSNFNSMFMILVSFFTFFIILSFKSFFMKNIYLHENNIMSNIVMIFSNSLFIMTLMLMFYLLYTLIVAVKISSKSEGPLRNMIK